MADPLVSVVLPAYGRLEYLRLAVASVFAQTWQAWELIIADDGSDDATRTYLRDLTTHSRVRVTLLEHSGRPAVVRNAALRLVSGTYAAFLDSDDVWLPDKLQLSIEALRKRVECRWSYTAFTRVDATGKVLPEEAHRL